MALEDQATQAPAEKDILEGGPGTGETPQPDPEPQPEPQPQLVSIRINGQTLTVTQEQADVILAREEAYNRKISEMGTELGTLRKQTQREEPKMEDPDANLAFFANPSAAIQARLEVERQTLREELRQEYRLERAREQWWADFYKENQAFVGRERLVNAVMAQEAEVMGEMDVVTARKHLSQAVNTVIRGAAQPIGTKTTLPNKPAATERPSGAPQPRPPAQVGDKPYGVVAFLKQRHQERRAARHAGKK